MQGDFSRYTFDPKKHYTQVLLQQGRVLTDADWNEQQAITHHHISTNTKDIIGQSGVLDGSSSFRIGSFGGLTNVQFID